MDVAVHVAVNRSPPLSVALQAVPLRVPVNVPLPYAVLLVPEITCLTDTSPENGNPGSTLICRMPVNPKVLLVNVPQ
jgi:hypothetical protein